MIQSFGDDDKGVMTMEIAEPRWPKPPDLPDSPIDEEVGDEEEETVPLPGNLLEEDEPILDNSPPEDHPDLGFKGKN